MRWYFKHTENIAWPGVWMMWVTKYAVINGHQNFCKNSSSKSLHACWAAHPWKPWARR